MFNSVSLTLYFNSRPHGGRYSHGAGIGSSFCISTHALTEGDVDKVPIIPTPSISTHALTEGDSFQKPPEALKRSFQLTPSRRATVYRETIRYNRNISTHALTEGDYEMFGQRSIEIISTHALTEGDHQVVPKVPTARAFQLTPSRRATGLIRWRNTVPTFQLTPSRRATLVLKRIQKELNISTHALTEGDSWDGTGLEFQ